MKKRLGFSIVIAILTAFIFTANNVLAAGGILCDWFLISAQPEDEVRPAIAYNNTRGEYLAVFYNDRTVNDDIHGVRLSRDDKVLDDFSIATGRYAERRYPDEAYNPDRKEYLVVWKHYIPISVSPFDEYSIRGQRLAENGTLIDAEIVVANPGSTGYAGKPTVGYASNPKNYRVAWEQLDYSKSAFDIKGQFVSDAGSLVARTTDRESSLDPSFYLALGDGDTDYLDPDLAYEITGDKCLVVWERVDNSCNPKNSEIYGRFVEASSYKLGAAAKIMANLTYYHEDNETNPSVAALPATDYQGQFTVVAEVTKLGFHKGLKPRKVLGNGNLGYQDDMYFTLASQSTLR